MTDLGFIHWGNKDFQYNFYQDARFTWEGADISNSVNKDNVGYISIDSAFTKLTDQLKDSLQLRSRGKAYTTMVSPKLYLGATYQLNRTFYVGGLFRLH